MVPYSLRIRTTRWLRKTRPSPSATSAGFLLITRFKLLLPDWRGYLIALFALVWVANQYMSIYKRLRLDIKHEQAEIKAEEQQEEQGAEQRKAA